MQTNSKHVTMDGEEVRLLERYEKQFGETPTDSTTEVAGQN